MGVPGCSASIIIRQLSTASALGDYHAYSLRSGTNSILESATNGDLASGPLRSAKNGIAQTLPQFWELKRSLQSLGSFSKRGCSLTVAVKLRKGNKKHSGKKGVDSEYPWPQKINLNGFDGSYLTFLSRFTPLSNKPKPVTLPFERPLVDLERKIHEVRVLAKETGIDFSEQLSELQEKYDQVRRDLYMQLSPVQRLSVARHPSRPTVLDHVLNMTDKWVELHGDRAGYDDPALVTGIGKMDGMSFMFIGHQKGRNTKENIYRNFAMPQPNGYRKALRMMQHAEHHGFPILTFIDTPGAYAGIEAEERGQGEAIARNLRDMFGFSVPIITTVVGEGGSGGALAIGCCDKMLMLENAVYYVASPEACAAILWKSATAAPQATEALRITALELMKLDVVDEIISEPPGGAHSDPESTSKNIKKAILRHMNELLKLHPETRIQKRIAKFRSMGAVQEGVEVGPYLKRNMKPREAPLDSSEQQQQQHRALLLGPTLNAEQSLDENFRGQNSLLLNTKQSAAM